MFLHGQPTDQHHKFHLEVDERIIGITPQTGWMIDRLTFHTNKDRHFGPYGGDGGGLKDIDGPPEGCKGFLAAIRGSIVETQGSLGITSLAFKWAYYPLFN